MKSLFGRIFRQDVILNNHKMNANYCTPTYKSNWSNGCIGDNINNRGEKSCIDVYLTIYMQDIFDRVNLYRKNKSMLNMF